MKLPVQAVNFSAPAIATRSLKYELVTATFFGVLKYTGCWNVHASMTRVAVEPLCEYTYTAYPNVPVNLHRLISHAPALLIGALLTPTVPQFANVQSRHVYSWTSVLPQNAMAAVDGSPRSVKSVKSARIEPPHMLPSPIPAMPAPVFVSVARDPDEPANRSRPLSPR